MQLSSKTALGQLEDHRVRTEALLQSYYNLKQTTKDQVHLVYCSAMAPPNFENFVGISKALKLLGGRLADDDLLIRWVAEIEASKPRVVSDFGQDGLKLKMLDRKWSFDDLKVTTAMLMQGKDEDWVLNHGIFYRGGNPVTVPSWLDEDLTPQQVWEKLPDKKYPIIQLRQSLRVLRVAETDDGNWLWDMFRELSGLEKSSDIRTYPWTVEDLKTIVCRWLALEDERTRRYKPKSTGSLRKERIPGAGNVQNTRQRGKTGKEIGNDSVVVNQAGEQNVPIPASTRTVFRAVDPKMLELIRGINDAQETARKATYNTNKAFDAVVGSTTALTMYLTKGYTVDAIVPPERRLEASQPISYPWRKN
ncbi:hypothetical protein F5883DRAFT_587381 [Diaporthe sp. PMI_573]|nr:hypothetical protein F5883DRAFT_587381 [Diaporthaceae sp. PMI_573]